jgi:TonB family protein
VIHFDLEDRYQDELIVGSAISRREGTIFSVLVHLAVILAIAFAPRLALFSKTPEELERERQLAEQQRDQDRATFVFVQPKVDLQSKPPQRAEMSDLDRRAQTREAAPVPQNPLPFSRGNSAERTETAPPEQAKGPENPAPQPPEPPKPEEQIARNLPPADTGLPRQVEAPRPRPQGALGDALRNLQRYVQNETFSNPQGGKNDPGSEIQFDTKGVEFGPWLRRFVAQVRRNWFVPQAAMTFRGRVVLQFNIHKSGRITDVAVVDPSSIDAFNRAAFNAILGSNPTEPLPPEYPDEKALFTVTFYYNETPPGAGQ